MKNATHPLNGHAPWTVHFADSSPYPMGSKAEALNYLGGNFAVVKEADGEVLAWDTHADAENDPLFAKVAARACPEG